MLTTLLGILAVGVGYHTLVALVGTIFRQMDR